MIMAMLKTRRAGQWLVAAALVTAALPAAAADKRIAQLKRFRKSKKP